MPCSGTRAKHPMQGITRPRRPCTASRAPVTYSPSMYQGRRALAVAIAAAALMGAGPAAAAEPIELESGALTVRVQPEPFQIEFVDGADGDVLRTLAGAPAEAGDLNARYGTLGFSFDLRVP